MEEKSHHPEGISPITMPPAKNDIVVNQDNARKNVHIERCPEIEYRKKQVAQGQERVIRNLAVLSILASKGNKVLMNTGGICTYVAEGLRLAVRPRLALLRHHQTSKS